MPETEVRPLQLEPMPCPACGHQNALTMKQAAEYCAIKLRTWEQYYRLWEVPHYKIGRTVVFKREELDEFISSRRCA